MFVRKSTYDAMCFEARACSEIAKVLAEELGKAIDERDDSRRRHAITETDACNQASRANDLQRQLDALKPPRGPNGKFCARAGDA
jgi:hypothetical protein